MTNELDPSAAVTDALGRQVALPPDAIDIRVDGFGLPCPGCGAEITAATLILGPDRGRRTWIGSVFDAPITEHTSGQCHAQRIGLDAS